MPVQRVKSTYSGMKRLREIAAVFLRHGFADMVAKINLASLKALFRRPDILKQAEAEKKGFTLAQRVRMAFEELGPSFVKLGQLLSSQPDIIPAEFVEEFKKLQDEVAPFSYEEVAEIIEFELGDSVENLFQEFSRKPIAAASIAQVHYAELLGGEKLAVKVQRPDIETIIREDIKILYKLARMLGRNVRNLELLNLVDIVREFEGFISKELDFSIEGGSIEKFRNNFSGDKEVYIPKVYWNMSTPKLLVIEHLEGIKIDEVEKIRQAGFDPKRIAEIGLTCFARQIMEHGFFHADPHPGNALVLPDGRVGLIDFGITGYLDPETMRQMANVVVGFANHDYDQLITVFLNMDLLNEKMDLNSFKHDLIELSEPYYGRPLEHIRIKEVFDKVVRLAIKHRIQLPRNLVLLFKSLVAGESMGRNLSTEINILQIMRPHAIRLLGQAYSPKTLLEDLKHDLSSYRGISRSIPELVHTILKHTAQGTQRLELHLSGLEHFDRDYGRSSNRLTIGIIIGTSVLGGAWILSSNSTILPISIPALGIYNISITTILGLVGYGIATILGIWLVISIFFSGRL